MRNISLSASKLNSTVIIPFCCALAIGVCCFSCQDQPKVIAAADETVSKASTGVFSSNTGTELPPLVSEQASGSDVHTVVVKDVLPTSKYVYLYVSEKGQDFWIATSKQEVNIGETYHYKGGLLKTNFQSKEHNRVFDKMFLVSRIVPVDHGNSAATAVSNPTPEMDKPETRDIEEEGSVRIANLIKEPEKYAGQTIQISGECVKVNPNIMGRNWLHLKDGSADDFDLVITSDLAVPEGHVVTMQATVALNKDFGAGYRYDIILEEGVLIR